MASHGYKVEQYCFRFLSKHNIQKDVSECVQENLMFVGVISANYFQ